MKGSEIAKKLNISTSALKHYESWGLVPKVERAENGYRIYTQEHVAYFQCIHALKSGFGMDLVREVMPLIIKGENIKALWIINQAQVHLQEEKIAANKAIQMLDLKEFPGFVSERQKKVIYTIGEVADIVNVSTSTIRHWEKEKLIEPDRDRDSGFRIYNASDLRKIIIIKTIQRSVYSLDIVRKVLSDIDNDNISKEKNIAQQSLQYIDHTLVKRISGIASLHNLLGKVSVSGYKE